MKRIILISLLMLCALMMSAQERIRLWSAEDGKPRNHAELWCYPLQDCDTLKPAVIICPGGSYHHLGLRHEGEDVAKWFNSQGFHAFVLRYRVSMDGFSHPAMLEDVERGITIIHGLKDMLKIDLSRLGAIGFSAGGHLVLMAGVFLPAELRPAWVAPIYPVVSMQDDIAHKRSRNSLWGKNPTQAQKDSLSMELQVFGGMPPVYLQVSDDDDVVIPENSIRLAEAMKAKGVVFYFNHLATGGHGYGMKRCKFNEESKWNETLLGWLREKKLY